MTAKLRTDRSRWLALYVLCVGVLMIVLDTTIVNVALPSIQSDLHFTDSSLAWVVNSYLIAFGGLLLLAGRIGDLFGRRRIFLIGLVIFTGASLLCGVAQNQEMLVAARFVQGVGGAMTSAVILGMIVTMFPEPQDQAKAIGVYAFVASAGGAVGLLVGGVLTQSISWHWIFFVNIPIGIATALAAGRLLDADPRSESRSGADVPGCRADHLGAHARRLHHREAGCRARLDRTAHPHPRRRLGGPDRGLPGPAGHGGATAHAAADLPRPRAGRRERHPDAVGGGHVRDVLPRRAVPAAGPRL